MTERLNMADRLTPNFTVREFTHSQTAARRGLDNTPDAEQLIQLYRLAHLLEEVRERVDAPIHISSGFRGWRVNAAVGGSRRSVHMKGRAADITAPSFGSAYDLAVVIANSDIPFDRMIFEGTWVHIEVAPENVAPRRQVMSAQFRRLRPTVYHAGLLTLEEIERKAA